MWLQIIIPHSIPTIERMFDLEMVLVSLLVVWFLQHPRREAMKHHGVPSCHRQLPVQCFICDCYIVSLLAEAELRYEAGPAEHY